MTQRVAERDHKITQLEQQLAVQKAMNIQLESLLKQNGYNPRSHDGT